MKKLSRYEHVVQGIIDKIEKDELQSDQQIPSESKLMEEYGVSRNTVREATSNLIMNNILYRKKGIGTFVKAPKVSELLSSKWSMKAELEHQGIEVKTTYCNIELLEDGPDEYKKYYVTRVRDSNKTPIVFSQSYIRTSLKLEEYYKQIEDSLYKLLDNPGNEVITRIEDEIELALADRVVAKFLNVEVGTPLLKKTRTGYDEHSNLIEKTFSYYDSKRYRYKVEFFTGEKNEL